MMFGNFDQLFTIQFYTTLLCITIIMLIRIIYFFNIIYRIYFIKLSLFLSEHKIINGIFNSYNC